MSADTPSIPFISLAGKKLVKFAYMAGSKFFGCVTVICSLHGFDICHYMTGITGGPCFNWQDFFLFYEKYRFVLLVFKKSADASDMRAFVRCQCPVLRKRITNSFPQIIQTDFIIQGIISCPLHGIIAKTATVLTEVFDSQGEYCSLSIAPATPSHASLMV